MSIPSVLYLLVFVGYQLINLKFVGHLRDPALIAAIGLGNLFQNIFFETFVQSLNSALENSVSQAFGAKNFTNAGVYLNRGILSLLIVYVLMIPIIMSC
jgi:Na+-driven multidrug efflux pump